ncbi:OLC1v1008903C1 [Oldenlandia corymbosa var. corymbosa]|uniref:OLC1v1008903C1 n=1 Tax=Oldenlandia corymbosa var. corymbosa TaxID=529605 RepID=A0AAV1DQ35_OLDCO|nr:OLC1v1008903C1 [Oldenlandia corymbosa var. corymbosa]
MASDLITSTNSAVDDMQFLVDCGSINIEQFVLLLFRLRNLKIFLVLTKKLGNDPSLGSFFQVVEDVVCKEAGVVRTLRLFLTGLATGEQANAAFELDGTLKIEDKTWQEPMDQLYVKILDTPRQSNSLTPNEVDDILTFLLQNLGVFHSLEWELDGEILGEPVKALEEQIIFLRNLCLFTFEEVSKVDEELLAHVETISINAAYLLFKCDADKGDKSACQDLLFKISSLMKEIKPIDPQVYETYIKVLSGSKVRRRSLLPADGEKDKEHCRVKEFLNSLISNLWERLQQLNSDDVVSLPDQLRELYKGLGSLGIILTQLPNAVELKAKDHIFYVVCDAGVLICSLYQTHQQLDDGIQHLLKAIRHIISDLGEKGAHKPDSNIPSTAPLSFVDSLVERLKEMTRCETETNSKSHPLTIEKELVYLRSFLGHIMELRHEQEEVQTLWDHVLELAYRVECLVDYLVVGDLSDTFSEAFDSIMKGIKNIKPQIEVRQVEIKMKGVTMAHSYHAPYQRIPSSLNNEVVGFLDEAKSIKNRLTRGLKQLQIVAIVGMPGQGKTTLAGKVYNDPYVSHHFLVSAQTTVSQIMDKRRVLFNLLSQIDPKKCSEFTSERDLVEKVWRSLKGKRYLIFLDDVWEAEAWNSLKEAFPEDHLASRIMLTSRQHDVAPDEEPHEVRPLNEEESMDLLQRKLFNGSCWPSESVDFGNQIAKLCKGLPLTIVIIAGVLATTKPECWKNILSGLRSGIVSSTEQCRNLLELSYSHLPEHLRPCLLYFAAFQEDEEVSVRRLLRLWIAEGFVRKVEMKCVEDVAEDYLKDLIGRSLLTVAKQRSIGGVKACCIHDLLHEFCLQKAKDERFFSFLGVGADKVLAFHELHNLRRLCVNSDPKHFISTSEYFPYVRSLRFNYDAHQVPQDLSFIFNICKLLRVLDLGQINIGRVFPSEIGLLVQLAFLAIRGYVRDIPPSVGNLSNLETLNLYQIAVAKPISLPDSFWNLQKLRHLFMTSPGGIFRFESLVGSSDLCELDRVSGLAIPYGANLEGLLKKFPNVRKLKCFLLEFLDKVENHVKIIVPDFLSQLESLGMSLFYNDDPPEDIKMKFEFILPANVKKLMLSGLCLYRECLSIISRLPNLEVLKLIAVSFEGDTWELEEEEFPKLRFLKLHSWSLRSWSASENPFGCLEKLVLRKCVLLGEMPSCLENISTLEVIQVKYCSDTLLELVGKIKEAQEDNGNSELKIITSLSD